MTTFKARTRLIHLALFLGSAAGLLPPSAPQRLPTRLSSLRTDAEAVLDLRRVDTSRSELVSPGESTISRLWDLETWARHQKVGRYWRHLRKWPRSTTARLVLPVCVAFSLWSCVAHALRTRYFPNFAAPLAPLTLISSAVALLLTLRMNLSLLRLQESRLAWGRLVLHARETAGLAATYCAAAPAEAICRHLAVLGWCLKASLRAGEDDSDVVSAMLPPVTAEAVLAARKRPVALLRGAHAIVAEEVSAGRLDAQAHLSLLTQLHSLNAQIGICERLLASPVPPTITRHTSRVLLSWLACVPLGLESLGLALPAVALATLGTSYVMVGIDQIGLELEQPFQLLPMNSLAAALTRDVVDEISVH